MTPTVRQALAALGPRPLRTRRRCSRTRWDARARGSLAHDDDPLPRLQADAFFALAKRRRAGEPVAYLTGTREFWGLSLRVTPDVLIPRPETETLVELALEWLPRDGAPRVLDLGTGSGAIALAIAAERPRARAIADDASVAALAVARAVPRGWHWRTWSSRRRRLVRRRALWLVRSIVSNPPYVAAGDPHLAAGDLRYEPAGALASGVDGLAALRTIIGGAPMRLAAGGALAVEHGYNQSPAVQDLLRDAGFVRHHRRRDLAGIPRVVGGRS